MVPNLCICFLLCVWQNEYVKIKAGLRNIRWIYSVGDCDKAADLNIVVFKELERDFETNDFIYFEDLFICNYNTVKILHSKEVDEMRVETRKIESNC